jgi:hypothetical protein
MNRVSKRMPWVRVYATENYLAYEGRHEVYIDPNTGKVEIMSVFLSGMRPNGLRGPAMVTRPLRRGPTYDRVMADLAERRDLTMSKHAARRMYRAPKADAAS